MTEESTSDFSVATVPAAEAKKCKRRGRKRGGRGSARRVTNETKEGSEWTSDFRYGKKEHSLSSFGLFTMPCIQPDEDDADCCKYDIAGMILTLR